MGKSVSDSRSLLSRGINYFKNGRFDKAIDVFRKAGNTKEAYLNLAACYMHTGQYSLARKYLDRIEDVPFVAGGKGFMVEAALNRGLLEYHLENDDSAVAEYRLGLETDKNYDLIWNYGITRLRQYCSNKYSDSKFAWQLYEARFRIFNAVKVPNTPNWTGGVHVDSITVMVEQGVGDNIMFGRYLSEVKKWCNRLVVQCSVEANGIFAGFEIINSTKLTTTHCISMCSLANLLPEIPAGNWIGGWDKARSERLEIGCVWRSNNYHSNGEIRNIPVDKMVGLLEYGNCYSLGPDCTDKRFTKLISSDWADTMAQLRELDVLVTVDTGIAHLAGAMGMPVLLMLGAYNTDWRWGDKSMGTSNLWYPNVKVIRNHGSWEHIVKDVIQCLK